jgi:hypothetical protein
MDKAASYGVNTQNTLHVISSRAFTKLFPWLEDFKTNSTNIASLTGGRNYPKM